MSDFQEVINYTGSSLIKTVWYSEEHQEMLIELQTGKAYAYYDVPKELVEKFTRAGSYGQFFNSEIKGKYTSQEMS